jgi:hypothetical protein
MVRLQRELTKHFFLHDNEKLLITFSCRRRAAPAERGPGLADGARRPGDVPGQAEWQEPGGGRRLILYRNGCRTKIFLLRHHKVFPQEYVTCINSGVNVTEQRGTPK